NIQYAQRWSYGYNPFTCPSSGLCPHLGENIAFFSRSTADQGGFSFGDSSAVLNQANTPRGTITSINNAEDWYVATFKFTHTYADCSAHPAFFESGARVDSIELGHGKLERVQVQVSPCTASGSAVASVPAIQAVGMTDPASFSLSAHVAQADPSDTLSYRLA